MTYHRSQEGEVGRSFQDPKQHTESFSRVFFSPAMLGIWDGLYEALLDGSAKP